MSPWLLYAAAAVILTWLLWDRIKTWLPASWQGTATGIIDKAVGYADESVAGGALGTAALLFKKHGDTEAVTQLGTLWGKAMAWDDKPPTPAITTVTMSPEIAAIASQVAALTKIVASQSVSVPPAASTGGGA